MNQLYKFLMRTGGIKKYLAVLIFVTLSIISYSQTPGMIIKPANTPGCLVLDPDGDGYVSQKTNGIQIGFTIPPDNDVLQSEIPYVPIVRPDPTGDLLRGPTGSFSEIVGTDAAGNNAVMVYNDGTNLLFRFRLGGYAPNSKSYSILIDSDQKFGTSGTNADINAVTGNMGFEIEIVLKTNFSVDVYNIDGVNTESDIIGTSPGYRVATHPYETNCQKSIAVSQAGLDPDYFYDFYIPFSDLSALGITLNTPLRFVTLTTMNPAGAIGNNALSDIGGVTSGTNIDAIFDDLINNQTPTSITNINNGGVLDRTSCPSINGPIYSDSNSISGTSSEANGTTIKVYQDGVLLGTTTVSSGAWTLSSVTGLVTGKTITATATATNKGTSYSDCSSRTVLAGGTSCTIPAPTNLVLATGNKELSFNYSGAGNVVTLYDASNNTAWTGTNNPLTTTSATSYTMGQSAGSNTVPTNFYLIATNGSCKSAKVFYCSSTFSTTPSITTPVTAGSTSISGTCGNAQTAVVTVFKNNVSQGTATVSGTSWTKTGLTLAINDELYVTSKEGTLCMTSSSVVKVSCNPSTTPTINQNVYTGDNVLTGTCGLGASVVVYKNGVLFGNASVSGTTWSIPISTLTTSTTFYVEATETSKCTATSSTITVKSIPTCGISGTYCGSVNTINGFISATSGTLQLYKENGVTDIAIGSPYTLTSSGNWQLTGLSLVGGDKVYAIATLPRGSTSTSSTITIGAKNTHIPTITTNPIYEGEDRLDGTGYNGDSINLYIGGALTTYTTTVSSGNWTLSSIPSYEFYLGAPVYATASAAGQCESDASATKIVQCVPPIVPSYTGGDQYYCIGGQGKIELDTSEVGIVYQFVNGSGVSQGPSVVGNGGKISLYTNQLNDNLLGLYVKAYKVMNSSCMITSTSAINFNNQRLSPSVTFSSLDVTAAEGSTSVNLSYSSKSSSPSADQYTIDFNTAANNKLFVDITSKATIPASAIVLSIPAGVSTGTYYGTITIYDAAGAYCPRSYGFSITIFGNSGSAPVISSQPTNTTICNGSSTTLTVSASGTITGYQWEESTTYNGTYANVTGGSGGTTANYTTANLNATKYYRVKVINGTLYTYSNVATVTVPALPSAAGSISGLSSICEGETAVTYSVDPISNATSYTWTYTGTNVTNFGTTNSISINFGNGATSGTLTVVGKNSCGSGTSSSLSITVKPKPTVTAGTSVCVGSTITLSPTTGGTWVSSDNSKATVDNSGLVTGISAGSATFTFTNSTTGCSATTPSVIVSSLNPTFSINDASISEGNSGTKNLNFTVSLASAVCGNVSVNYATSNGTATTANNDYLSTSGTLTIVAGNTSGTISVPIIGDKKVEADESFTVTLSSPSSGTISDANGVGTITNDDNSPSIADAIISINENTPNSTVIKDVNNLVTGNDFDIDGDQNNYSILSGNESGAFAINITTGVITVADYTKLDFETTPSFTLTIQATDGYNSSTATITINLNNVNDLSPVIDDVTVSLAENSPNGTAVTNINDKYTGNDLDREGQAITYIIISGNSSGAFTINPSTGEITVADYTKLDFESTPTFTLVIQASDGVLTDNATVTINLTNVNEAPVVSDFTKNGTEDITLNFTSTDFTSHYSDVESTALSTVMITSLPINGTLKLLGVDIALNQVISAVNLTNITFIPNPNWNGSTSFNWNASDGSLYALIGKTVTINIAAVNDAPVTVADSYTVAEGGTLNVSAPGVLSNDTDAEGNALTAIKVTNPVHGSLTLNADGSFTYTHDGSETTSDSFTYKSNDGTVDGNTVTVTITITPVNDAPVAVDDSYTVAEGATLSIAAPGLLSNDSDAEGNVLNVLKVSDPLHGTLTLNADGSFTYVHDDSETTSDSYTYKVFDGAAYSNVATVNISVTPVNDPPIAADNTIATPKNTDKVIQTSIFGYSDIEGDALTLIKITALPTAGTLYNDANGNGLVDAGEAIALNGTIAKADIDAGKLKFKPATNAYGVPYTTFSFKVNDGTDYSTSAYTITINVTNTNSIPVAVDDNLTLNEDESKSIDVAANDTNLDDGSLVVSVTTIPQHGTYSISGTTVTYTPNPNYNGSDNFVYQICDGNGDCSSATVYVTVNPVNDNPIAVNDAVTINEDGTATGNLLANDSDPDGDPLTINTTPVVGPIHGTLVINSDGTFTYTPDSNYNGTDTFTYEVCDNHGACSQATVTITINAVNDKPNAVDDTFIINEDGTATGNLLANDSDSEGDPLTINTTPISGSTHGTVVINSDGTFTYTPDPNYNGTDSFTYEVCDNNGACSQATVTVTINAVNDKPIAVNDAFIINEDGIATGNLLANDSDPEGDPLTINTTPVSGPTHGSVVINSDGSFTYTPDSNYNGTDTFTYEVCDSHGACSQATVTITINPVNDNPIVGNDTATTDEDAVATGNLLTNDSDPDGDPLTINTTPVVEPGHGSVVINSDGSFTYTPDPNYNRTDSFTYKVYDGTVDGNTVTVTITINSVNTAPVAVDDSYSVVKGNTLTVNQASGVLSNDSDAENNTLSAVLISTTSHGTLTLNTDGSFTYVNDGSNATSDGFTYKVNDGFENSNTATVTITITTVNSAPVAVDDSYTVAEGATLTINSTSGVLSNDTDADSDALTAIKVTNPTHGTLTLNVNGSFTYTHDGSETTIDSFTYKVNDGTIDGNTATVTITITPVNDLPVAVADSYSVNEGETLTVSAPGVLTNDSDAEGSFLTAIKVTNPSHGTLTFNSNGSFTYVHDGSETTSDSFTYKVNDGTSDGNTVTVTITINSENDLPVAVNDVNSISEGEAEVTGNILVNDTDAENNTLQVLLINGSLSFTSIAGSYGTLTCNSNGDYTYTLDNNNANVVALNDGQTLTETFTYKATDGTGESNTATLIITINGKNDVEIIVVPEGFTPDGDGINDTFIIDGLSNYPENELVVFNRWGTEVYRKKNYNNEWNGRSSVTESKLPVGTYFYVLTVKGKGSAIKGFVYLKY